MSREAYLFFGCLGASVILGVILAALEVRRQKKRGNWP